MSSLQKILVLVILPVSLCIAMDKKRTEDISLTGEIEQMFDLMETLESQINNYFDVSGFLFSIPGIYGDYKNLKSREESARKDAQEILNNFKASPSHRDAAREELSKPPLSSSKFFAEQLIGKFIDYLALEKIPLSLSRTQQETLSSPQLSAAPVRTLARFCNIDNLKALFKRMAKDYFSKEVINPESTPKLINFLEELKSQPALPWVFETTDPHTDWHRLTGAAQDSLKQRMPGTSPISPEFKRMLSQIKAKSAETFAIESSDLVKDWNKLNLQSQQNIIRRMHAIDYIELFRASLHKKAFQEEDTSAINLDSSFKQAVQYYKSASTIEFDKAVDLPQTLKYLGFDFDHIISFPTLTRLINARLQGNHLPKTLILQCFKFNSLFRKTDPKLQDELNQALHGLITLWMDFTFDSEDRWVKIRNCLTLYAQAGTGKGLPVSRASLRDGYDENVKKLLESPASLHTNLLSALEGASSQMLSVILNRTALGLDELYEALFIAVRDEQDEAVTSLLLKIEQLEKAELLKECMSTIERMGLKSIIEPLSQFSQIDFDTIKEMVRLIAAQKTQIFIDKMNESKNVQMLEMCRILLALMKNVEKDKIVISICRRLGLKSNLLLAAYHAIVGRSPAPAQNKLRALFVQKAPHQSMLFEEISAFDQALTLLGTLSDENFVQLLYNIIPIINIESLIECIAQEQTDGTTHLGMHTQLNSLFDDLRRVNTTHQDTAFQDFRHTAEELGHQTSAAALLRLPGITTQTLLNLFQIAKPLEKHGKLVLSFLSSLEERTTLNRLNRFAHILSSCEKKENAETAWARVYAQVKLLGERTFGSFEAACVAASAGEHKNGLRQLEHHHEPDATEMPQTELAGKQPVLSPEIYNELRLLLPTLKSLDSSIKRNLLLKRGYDPYIVSLSKKSPTEAIDALFKIIDDSDKNTVLWWAVKNEFNEVLDALFSATLALNQNDTIESILYWAAENNVPLVSKIISSTPIELKARETILYWSAKEALNAMRDARRAKNQLTTRKNAESHERNARSYGEIFNLLLSKPGIEASVIDHALVGALTCFDISQDELTLDPLINSCNGWGDILFYAVKHRYKHLTAFLLELPIERDEIIVSAHTAALREALQKGDRELIAPFLTWPLPKEINERVLLWAARYGYDKLVFTNEFDPDMDVQDESGNTVLDLALATKNKALITRLIRVKKLRPLEVDKIFCWAAEHGHADTLVDIFTMHGSSLQPQTIENAFDLVVLKNQMAIAHMLLTQVPHKALVWAATSGEFEIVKNIVYTFYSETTLPIESIKTAFIGAALAGHLEIVKYLVTLKIDFITPDSAGISPLEQAKESTDQRVRRYLATLRR